MKTGFWPARPTTAEPNPLPRVQTRRRRPIKEKRWVATSDTSRSIFGRRCPCWRAGRFRLPTMPSGLATAAVAAAGPLPTRSGSSAAPTALSPRLSDPDDKRRKSYRLTRFGERLLGHPEGGRLLRHARKLFTSCPSPRSRRNQAQHRSRVPEIEFQRLSDLLLNLFRNPDGTPLSRDATRDGSASS